MTDVTRYRALQRFPCRNVALEDVDHFYTLALVAEVRINNIMN